MSDDSIGDDKANTPVESLATASATAASARVVTLRARSGAEELERLNRVTGLAFDTLPTSLLDAGGGLQLAQDDGEELIYRALYLWDERSG